MKKIFLIILKLSVKKLAKATIKKYKPAVIGITGSVGKTSTKETVKAVVKHERAVRATSKNFNNELGLPLTILGDWSSIGGYLFWIKVIFVSIKNLVIKNKLYPEVLILEYGVDRPGDMDYLLQIVKPHIGIFTAMGDIPVHVEFFANPKSVFREKIKMITKLSATGFAILNGDDKFISNMDFEICAHVIKFGLLEKSDIRIISFSNILNDSFKGVSMKIVRGGNVVPVQIRGVLGKAQAYSVGSATAVGMILGMNLVSISEALSGYISLNGRMKIISGINNSTIIDDTYNSSPIAVKEALETIKNISAKKKIIVLGDMLEIGKYTLKAHRSIGKQVARMANVLITVGVRGKFIAESAIEAGMPKRHVFTFLSIKEAGEFLHRKITKNSIVLVKGSQGVRMEKIVKKVMSNSRDAKNLLVRQSEYWLARKGLYE